MTEPISHSPTDSAEGMAVAAPDSSENHRTRVGRERRGRTGRRILAAVFTIVDNEGVDALTIDRIAETAGLSRGAFYTYASHLDDLLVRVSHLVWDQVRLEQSELLGQGTTPLARMSRSLRYGIHRSLSDQAIGPVLFKSLDWDGTFGLQMRAALMSELETAARHDAIDVDSLDTAADLCMG